VEGIAKAYVKILSGAGNSVLKWRCGK